MSGDVFLTDDEIEVILSVLDAPQTNAVWSETMGLISDELRHFLARGCDFDSCRLAILRGVGGCQLYVPKVSTFLTMPKLFGSRTQWRGKPPSKTSVHQHYAIQAREILKARGRLQIRELTNELHRLNAQKKAVTEKLTELKAESEKAA
ncbi:MAG: hypothetical protein BWK73_50895 [Thiothrix lacustris]|uniref:Uncharacterized protein n=1 Tax=Thiothrix lacustris TaxID=525917 RepID=A0A1Y1Q8E8_9GAMM|nr:MAG: hypothetical protein BWK73_50895 [Thiothrix lacustris]